ncbi:MAG: 2,3-bisphosphoglycerate-independent phosphoglycerate mutase, partial [Pseudomonadota bacterium]
MTNRPRPVALLILDGFGHREATEGNAIAAAKTPNWDRLRAAGTHGLIDTSGERVGLPDGQMGNSEVGHLNLGAGRVVYQDYTRISAAIADGSIEENKVLCDAMDGCAASGRTLHFLGLLSPGGVHSHEEHLYALIRMAKARGVSSIAIHAILDGRDRPPKSAAPSIEKLQAVLDAEGVGHIASLAGRFWAMDRDNRWDRVEKAYRLYADGRCDHTAADALSALNDAYARDETDEFVTPVRVGDGAVVADGDAVVFWNYRADRAREITRAFIEPGFDGFEDRHFVALRRYVCLTEYHADFDAPVAFGPLELPNSFGEILADKGLTQLRIAETEKYAHVTFFFNGGVDAPFPGEQRILVP